MFSWFLVVSQESFQGGLEKAASGVLGVLSSFALTDLALFAPFALTYSMYAAGAKSPAFLLDRLFQLPLSREGAIVLVFYTVQMRCGMMGPIVLSVAVQ